MASSTGQTGLISITDYLEHQSGLLCTIVPKAVLLLLGRTFIVFYFWIYNIYVDNYWLIVIFYHLKFVNCIFLNINGKSDLYSETVLFITKYKTSNSYKIIWNLSVKLNFTILLDFHSATIIQLKSPNQRRKLKMPLNPPTNNYLSYLIYLMFCHDLWTNLCC